MTKQIVDDDDMLDEYDIENLNPRPNPYANRPKIQITINLNESSVKYFKEMSKETGIPYQNLINLYLEKCVKDRSRLTFVEEKDTSNN